MFTLSGTIRLLFTCLAGLVLLQIGCSDDGGTKPPPPDSLKAEEVAAEAGESLATLMTSVVDPIIDDADSSFRPDDIDFSQVHAKYQEALGYDAGCKNAKFGVAFTGILMFLVDDDFNDLVEDYKHLYDTLEFNPLRPGGVAPVPDLGGKPLVEGIPLKAGRFRDLIPSPLALDQAMVGMALADPNISEIQQRIDAVLLPSLVEARQHLEDLLEDPNYTFVITPEMQGNDGASQIVLDRSDFQVFLALVQGAEAGLHVFLARNFDVDSYTTDGITKALRKDSSFGSLKGSGVGTGHMTAAKTRVLGCLEAVKQAVDYLKLEVGTSQMYDLIKVYSNDLSALNDVYDAADSILWYFDGPRELDIIWSDWDCYEVDGWWYCDEIFDTVAVTVDINKFFDAPIANFKDFIPNYTITVTPAEQTHQDFADLNFNRMRYWDNLDRYFDRTIDTPFFAVHMPDTDSDEFYRFLAEERQAMLGWYDLYDYCNYPPYQYPDDIWCFWSENQWYYEELYEAVTSLEVCYDWSAAAFETWEFPNPTMNGLFPGMTSDRLKEIWSDDMQLEWYPSDCQTINIDIW